jgi:hypothetical protein
MVKVTFFLIFIGFNITRGFSLYLGNPASPDMPYQGLFLHQELALGCKAAYAKDHVFSKKFSRNPTLELARKANMALVVINWKNFLELYGAIGQEKIGFKQETASLLKEAVLDWSFGGKAIIIEWGNISLCGAGAYLESYPRSWNSNNTYQEWEISLGLARNIDYFSLYALGGFSKAYLSYDKITLKNINPFLLALGVSFFTKKGFSANGELRFFSETALGFEFSLKL